MKFVSFRSYHRNNCKGFSLTEVVLALGIVAFAFIPVLGLLPLGLDTSRQAIDATIEAQIVQQLGNEAQQTDFSNRSELENAGPCYFDYQGNKTSEENAVYSAGFLVSDNTGLPSDVTTQRLATITICVINTQTAKSASEPDPCKNPKARKSFLLIADNGR